MTLSRTRRLLAATVVLTALPALALPAVAQPAPTQRVPVAGPGSDRPTPLRRALRIADDEQLVVRDEVEDPDGRTHLRLDRTVGGVPVVGADVVAHLDARGVVRSTSGGTAADLSSVRLRPSLPAARALGPARRASSAVHAVRTDAPRLRVLAEGRRAALVWEVRVHGSAADQTDVDDSVFVDARTGRVHRVEPHVFTAGTGRGLYVRRTAVGTARVDGRFVLRDTARGGHTVYDAGNRRPSGRGTLMKDADDVWGNNRMSSRQTVAVDAAYAAAKTWDFYAKTFGRNGVADNGRSSYSRVHFGKGYDNAFWSDGCACMTYGDGGDFFRPLVSAEIVGHEITHGVTSRTAHLTYEGEPGGLNESTSDVMGTMIEFSAGNAADPGDYLIGERVTKRGGWVRRMDNPSADGRSPNCWTSTVGRRDPHYSSGVGNHAFYLMAEGSGTRTIGGRTHRSTTCDGSTVTGIGRDAAARVWYRALTVYWTSDTGYAGAANGLVLAARDLLGADSEQCGQVLAAWRAVKVRVSATCAAETTDPTNLVRNPGFERGTTSWRTSNEIITASPLAQPRTGLYYAWLGGFGTPHTDVLKQRVDVPTVAPVLSLWLAVGSDETATRPVDVLRVQAVDATGTTRTLASWSNLDTSDDYVLRQVDLSPVAGQTVWLQLAAREDDGAPTSFLVDDVRVAAGP